MAGAQAQLHVYPHFNHEEAAAVAAEFVQSKLTTSSVDTS